MTATEVIKFVAPIATAMLPPNSTPLEKALLSVELAALAETDATVIAAIWNPQKCPTILLPFLAWSLSVDVWDHDWPETTKRNVIAASPNVHRFKGTRFAVDEAVEAMGFRTRLNEWWLQQPVGRRGTFEVILSVTEHFGHPGEPILTPQAYNNGVAGIMAAKPKSRVVDIKLAAGFTAKLGAANVVDPKTVSHHTAIARPQTAQRSVIGVASAADPKTLSRRTVLAKPITSNRTIIGLATAFRPVTVSRLSFVA